MVDVSQYKLIPKHMKSNDEAAEGVLREYSVEKTNPPKIGLKDLALPEDTESGNVIKIVWNSRTTDKVVIYRLMIE